MARSDGLRFGRKRCERRYLVRKVANHDEGVFGTGVKVSWFSWRFCTSVQEFSEMSGPTPLRRRAGLCRTAGRHTWSLRDGWVDWRKSKKGQSGQPDGADVSATESGDTNVSAGGSWKCERFGGRISGHSSFGSWSSPGCPPTDTAVEGSTLKGNEAQGSNEQKDVATRTDATDSTMEKGLEVERRNLETGDGSTARRKRLR